MGEPRPAINDTCKKERKISHKEQPGRGRLVSRWVRKITLVYTGEFQHHGNATRRRDDVALATLCFHVENGISTCQMHKLVVAIWLKPIGVEGMGVVCFIIILVKFT